MTTDPRTFLVLVFVVTGWNLPGSSPPSPVFDLPPIRFIAIARVVCASVEIDPNDIAPVANRLTISVQGSTSSIGTGSANGLISNRPRNVIWRRLCWLIISAYSLYVEYSFVRVALCKVAIESGVHICASPRTLNAYSPPASSESMSVGSFSLNARLCSLIDSTAIS